jgi:CHAT domain-containing protein
LLSGIVLAGANRKAKLGEEDSILTALEVAELDLRKLDLVVLSACETGLGEVAGGEGVLGLQRAFGLAGARTLVASLWSENDAGTSLLMEEFYKHLLGEKKTTKLEALRQAQLFVLRHPDLVDARARELKLAGRKRGLAREGMKGPPVTSDVGRSHPALWAGFVLSGDWR